jgi:hypothetical protein
MPEGYRMSSGNNARLVAAGKRCRGGRCEVAESCHLPSLPPVGGLDGPAVGTRWYGLSWSSWRKLGEASVSLRADRGVYRIRGADDALLLYIGEGVIGRRLDAHLAKAQMASHRQSAIFGRPGLECSFVVNDEWYDHQRLEIENDLIAAHVLTTGLVPEAQFIG